MAVIQPYTERVSPQGSLNAQASGDDFGAQIGRAQMARAEAGRAVANSISSIGQGITNAAEAVYQNDVQNDVTSVHVAMAAKRAEWQQKLNDMANKTQPGDQSLAPRVMEGLQSDFDKTAESVKTRAGQNLFSRMAADMKAMFGQEAIGIQSRLNGEFAKNQYAVLSKSLGTIASQDHTQVASLTQQALAAIDDPNSIYGRLPQPTREAFRNAIQEEIQYDAARGFARRFPNAVLGSVPEEIRTKVQEVVANVPKTGLPPNLNADTVKPYDQTGIDSRAKLIAAPSQYDKIFQAAANQYNIDWRELKLRAVVESGMQQSVSSRQGAMGLMQFTKDTAERYGVDPMDPVSSIYGAAKVLAQYRTQAKGDMAVVDMMYYGGESGKGWGPNTRQYAANMAALRQAVGMGSEVDPSAFAPSPTAMMGASQDWKKPKTGIDFIDTLPADKFFAVLSQAEQYQRAYDTMSERSRRDDQARKVERQEASMDLMTQRIFNPKPDNGGPITEIEIAGNTDLTSTQKQHMISVLNAHSREMTSRMEPKNNPAAVRAFELRIHAPDGDPNKIFNSDPLYDALKNGAISTNEFRQLDSEVRQLRDGSTNGFIKDVNNARNIVERTFTQNTVLQAMDMAQPGVLADTLYRFNRDMERRITQYRAENKDPRVLLDPDSSEYLLKPERIRSFIPSSASTISTSANTAAQNQMGTLPKVANAADYDKLPKGTTFIDPNGNVRMKP